MTMTWALGHLPWTPCMILVRASMYVAVETLLAAFWSLVPMLITTMSAAGWDLKSQGSGSSAT